MSNPPQHYAIRCKMGGEKIRANISETHAAVHMTQKRKNQALGPIQSGQKQLTAKVQPTEGEFESLTAEWQQVTTEGKSSNCESSDAAGGKSKIFAKASI